jgi:hypothetical protein
VEQFASFGLNMHLGTRGKKSKTKCIFCSAPPAAYTDPSTCDCDGADLTDIDMGQGKSIQCVFQCLSLGTIICGDSSCGPEINRGIGLGYGSMAKMKNKVYGSKFVPWPTQVAIYETTALPIVLCACKAWTINQAPLDKLEAFNNAALPAYKRFSGDACFAGLLTFPDFLVGPLVNNAAAPRAERGCLPPYIRPRAYHHLGTHAV